jgi:hypothetical protein
MTTLEWMSFFFGTVFGAAILGAIELLVLIIIVVLSMRGSAKRMPHATDERLRQAAEKFAAAARPRDGA